mmetsp:Transcript_19357/g.49017  ORF Transcript_19357/g.49017 Transcript_19357/m.49017 type:complete len:327 (-) Transcript_19357:1184-2164(-)
MLPAIVIRVLVVREAKDRLDWPVEPVLEEGNDSSDSVDDRADDDGAEQSRVVKPHVLNVRTATNVGRSGPGGGRLGSPTPRCAALALGGGCAAGPPSVRVLVHRAAPDATRGAIKAVQAWNGRLGLRPPPRALHGSGKALGQGDGGCVVLPGLVVKALGGELAHVEVEGWGVLFVDRDRDRDRNDRRADLLEHAVSRQVGAAIRQPDASSRALFSLARVLKLAVTLDALPPMAQCDLDLGGHAHSALPSVHVAIHVLGLSDLEIPPQWILRLDLPRHRCGNADGEAKVDGLFDALDARCEVLCDEEAGKVSREGGQGDEGEEPKAQ